MFPIPPDQTFRIFPLLLGSLVILMAVMNKQLLHFVGLKPMSEVFTTPRLQRLARINEKLGRLFLVTFGIGCLLQGIGSFFFSNAVVNAASWAVVGLAVLIMLTMIGVVLFNWKA